MRAGRRSTCFAWKVSAPREQRGPKCIDSTRLPISGHDHPSILNGSYKPTVTVQGGSQDGKAIQITKPVITLGRLPDNEVVLNEPNISGKHAEIAFADSGCYLRDLGSTNGTFVNLRDIGEAKHLLKDGDRIRLDDSALFVVFRDTSAVPHSADQGVKDVESSDLSEKPSRPPDHELFEGTVRLNVEAGSQMPALVKIVSELRQMPEFRLLRMKGNAEEGLDILLKLREPVHLKEVLADIDGVSHVSQNGQESDATATQGQEGEVGPEAQERVFNVRLTQPTIDNPG